jgi:hypothetical protein
LRDVDVDVRLSAAAVQIGKEALGRTAASLSLRDGALTIDLPDVSWPGQRGSVQLAVDARALVPRVTLRGRSEAADLPQWLTQSVDRPVIAGAISSTFELRGQGTTLAELGPTLSGRVNVLSVPQSGVRLWIDPVRFAQAGEAGARGQPRSFVYEGHALAAVDDLDVRLHVAQRQITVERGTLRTRGTILRVSGHVDRADGRLTGQAQVWTNVDIRNRRTVTDLPGAPKYVLPLGGTWMEPAVASSDPSAPLP